MYNHDITKTQTINKSLAFCIVLSNTTLWVLAYAKIFTLSYRYLSNYCICCNILPMYAKLERTDTLPIHLSGHFDVYLNQMSYITKQYVFPNMAPIYHKIDVIVSSITI